MKIDATTRRHIRNAADERAAANGCRFDEERAAFAVNWIQSECHLYEGEQAGQKLELRDWQLEATEAIFGWVKRSEEWGRDVRRFRRASIWIAKKNGKSPSLAAWGLYLLCGDGEQGQKIYSVAKDGKQAMIAHRHAIEMVKRSPGLMRECTINKSTGQITHLPTVSYYQIVAGDNINSQEGLNGSVMVDETHVVDRRLMRVLKGAGISRSEPLHIEVSTAGNNPDGYGKERFDYAKLIAEGKAEDEQLYALIFAAPQDLKDADLDADPVKWGKLANPAWGRIVKESEFLADYRDSRRTVSTLADFKMYRLNIWQRASNPWLRADDWAKCRRDFTEADLHGRECVAGLDLSKTQDMTAMPLLFPDLDDPEACYVLPYFWLPEKTAHAKNHLVPFLDWAAKGLLTLTPGDVIDYGFIRSHFRELSQKFTIRFIGYDKTYAEETTQSLEQGVVDKDGQQIEEGTGVQRVIIPQTIMGLAAPTKEMERRIIAGKFWHNGHPILDWQAGHVEVKKDANNNLRPVKPDGANIKKIDGIVAAINALAVLMNNPTATPSVSWI